MDEIGLNELLQIIIRDKGGSPQQYNQLMDYVAFHETGPVDSSLPDQRMKPDAKQWRKVDGKWVQDGTGRGLFMFESGHEAGGNKASNDLANILKKEGIEKPKWLNDIWAGKKKVDASKLNADQQKMLFLAYHRQHKTSDFSKLWSGEQSTTDFWAKQHWAGNKDIPGHMDLFNKSMLAKDSIDARNIREEELFQIKDKVPFQSAENDINNLPSKDDILKGIFGQQESSLIETKKESSNIFSKREKENYLSKLHSGYYNYTPPGNTPHFSQDSEVQRSWWDKITDTKYNYRNMGRKSKDEIFTTDFYSSWDEGAKANPQSELWEGRPNPYRNAGAKVTTNPIELAVMGGGSLLKKLLLSPTDKSGIVDKGYTPKESGKKIFKKTAETLLKNVNKNPFMQQNLVNRVDEAKGKDLSKFQKFSDDMFLSRRFFQLFNPSK